MLKTFILGKLENKETGECNNLVVPFFGERFPTSEEFADYCKPILACIADTKDKQFFYSFAGEVSLVKQLTGMASLINLYENKNGYTYDDILSHLGGKPCSLQADLFYVKNDAIEGSATLSVQEVGEYMAGTLLYLQFSNVETDFLGYVKTEGYDKDTIILSFVTQVMSTAYDESDVDDDDDDLEEDDFEDNDLEEDDFED